MTMRAVCWCLPPTYHGTTGPVQSGCWQDRFQDKPCRYRPLLQPTRSPSSHLLRLPHLPPAARPLHIKYLGDIASVVLRYPSLSVRGPDINWAVWMTSLSW